MAIQFKLLPDGGFVCGDTQTKKSSYAYPTSVYANDAKLAPREIARRMLADFNIEWSDSKHLDEYNAENWEKLNS